MRSRRATGALLLDLEESLVAESDTGNHGVGAWGAMTIEEDDDTL
jgi:hypothetical protein